MRWNGSLRSTWRPPTCKYFHTATALSSSSLPFRSDDRKRKLFEKVFERCLARTLLSLPFVLLIPSVAPALRLIRSFSCTMLEEHVPYDLQEAPHRVPAAAAYARVQMGTGCAKSGRGCKSLLSVFPKNIYPYSLQYKKHCGKALLHGLQSFVDSFSRDVTPQVSSSLLSASSLTELYRSTRCSNTFRSLPTRTSASSSRKQSKQPLRRSNYIHASVVLFTKHVLSGSFNFGLAWCSPWNHSNLGIFFLELAL
jgi:hypothetical protein